jgi:crotonobetaine/carnitine-CoA ligase
MESTTMIELLRAGCERDPQKSVLVFDDGFELTRGELRDLVEAFAGFLRDKVEPGDRVVIAMDNRAEFMIAYFAVVGVRCSVVPMNPESGPDDAGHVLRDSGAVLAIVDERGAAVIASCTNVPALHNVVALSGGEPAGLPAGAPVRLEEMTCEPTDVIAITYTSGTTGLPKGVIVDHSYMVRVTQVALDIHHYGPDDRIFYPVKFFYADALLALLRALQCGGAYIAARRFSVSRYWDTVRTHGATVLSLIGAMPAWLLKEPPTPIDRDHGVRFAIQAQIPKEIHAALDARWGFPWLENYGLSESGIVCRVPVELAETLRGSGSVGPPAPGVEIEIRDDAGSKLAQDELGEVVVRQPGMFRGYLHLPEATAERLRDGWIYTGDLGRLDERGFLFIEGRKKDVIRRSGENISADEVEMALRSHRCVFDVAVIGVPDPEVGEEVKAYVQLAELPQPPVTASELAAYCATRLARHKVPRYFAFVSEFSRTPSMRVRKEILRAASALDGPATGAWDRRASDARSGSDARGRGVD